MKKRILSLLLTLVMVVTMLPAPVFANTESETVATVEFDGAVIGSYTTFVDAWNAAIGCNTTADKKATITLTKNCSVVWVGNPLINREDYLVLDTGIYDLTVSLTNNQSSSGETAYPYGILQKGGSLDLIGSGRMSFEGGTEYCLCITGGTVTLDGPSVEQNTTGDRFAAIYFTDNASSFIMRSGTVIGKNRAMNVNNSADPRVELHSGTLQSGGDMVVKGLYRSAYFTFCKSDQPLIFKNTGSGGIFDNRYYTMGSEVGGLKMSYGNDTTGATVTTIYGNHGNKFDQAVSAAKYLKLETMDVHTHRTCGAHTCEHSGCVDVIYLPWDGHTWTEASEYPEYSTSCYLIDDVVLPKTYQVSGNICLNGHTISLAENKTGSVLSVPRNYPLKIADCSQNQTGVITGGNAENGGGIYSDGGYVYLYGGTITGNTATNGGGVHNDSGLHMHGGLITGNTATNGGGVWAGTFVYLSGDAAIYGNYDSSGNASNLYLTHNTNPQYDSIKVEGPLTGTKTIGVTTEDTPTENASVILYYNEDTDYSSKFTSDKSGFTVEYVNNNLLLRKIIAPTYSITYDDDGGAAVNGSYTTNVTNSILAGTSVTINPTPAPGYQVEDILVFKTGDTGTTVAVTNNTFTMPDYSVTVKVTFSPIEHDHCVCGATHAMIGEHQQADEKAFLPVSTEAQLQEAATNGGNVYLINDIAITNIDTVTVAAGKTLTLCLNGKKLSYAGPGKATIIKVAADATLNITDCGTNTRAGYIDSTTKLWTEGTGSSSTDVECNLIGGVITGGTGSTTANWGTYHAGAIKNYGTVYIYSGNIAGNQAIDTNGGDGGAIFNATGSDLYVYGGSIVGNYADESIIYNYEENNVVFTGNAVFAYNTLTNRYSLISSGYGYGSMEISGNASFSHNDGGTLVSACYEPMIVKGSASFTDNQVNEVIYYSYSYELADGKDFRMDGSILMERNTKPDDGSPATDLSLYYEYIPDALITLTAPLTRSYSVQLPYFLEGGVLAKGDGTNVTKLTAADAAKFTDVDGRPIAAANDVVYAGRVILDQPTKDNSYTVNATDNPTYQWYEITTETYPVTDEEVTWRIGSYDSGTGKWSATGLYARYGYYFSLPLYAGDVITLVFDGAVDGVVEISTYQGEEALTLGEGNTYTYTAPFDGSFLMRVHNENSAAPAMPADSSSGTTYPAVTASVYGKVLTAVDGQTDAKLYTENLDNGTYVCEVTWPGEDEDDDPYILMSDEVEYHSHKYTYTASGNVISEKCTCGHEATATLTAPTGNLTYDGAEKKATVAYSDGWQGGALTVSYTPGNVNAGSVTASITKENATASVQFVIEKLMHTVTYKADGNVVKTVTVEHGADVIDVPATPAKTGYTAAWDKDGKNITADTIINAVYTISKYTVTYKADGEVVKTVEVEHGKDATAPEIPTKEGYDETAPKWDKDGKNITADITITAVYTKNEPGEYEDVTYTASGNVISEKCTCGHEATATLTAPTGNLTYDGTEKKATVAYSDGWQGGALTVSYTPGNVNAGSVTASITKENATASVQFVIEKLMHTVTYKADGKVVKMLTVEHGKDATAPEIPTKEGYDETAPKWDKDGKNITADITITAVYTKNEPGEYEDVTPDTNLGGGKLTEEIKDLKEKVPFTKEEEKQIEYGADVDVWLEIKDISASVPAEDKKEIDKKLGDGAVALYLDIAMFKQIGENDASRLTQLSDKVQITFKLADSYINTDKDVTRTYSIIHVHDGKAEVITPVFDAKAKTLTFETDRFSTYAVVYTDVTTKSPATGDSFQPVLWVVCMSLSVTAAALLLDNKKRCRK